MEEGGGERMEKGGGSEQQQSQVWSHVGRGDPPSLHSTRTLNPLQLHLSPAPADQRDPCSAAAATSGPLYTRLSHQHHLHAARSLGQGSHHSLLHTTTRFGDCEQW